MPLNSTDFNQIFNIAPSGHLQPIHNIIKDTRTSQDFNQILNIAPSGHVQSIHNVIIDISPSEEHQDHHQLQQEP